MHTLTTLCLKIICRRKQETNPDLAQELRIENAHRMKPKAKHDTLQVPDEVKRIFRTYTDLDNIDKYTELHSFVRDECEEPLNLSTTRGILQIQMHFFRILATYAYRKLRKRWQELKVCNTDTRKHTQSSNLCM